MAGDGAAGALRTTFQTAWSQLQSVGRDPRTGGYNRFAWTGADLEMREWFVAEATRRGLDVEVDRNGNQWAWWGHPGPDSLPASVTGLTAAG